MTDIVELAKACRRASYDLAVLETSKKNEALNNIAKVLQEHKDEIFSANKLDVQQACDNKLNQALVDRLTLNDSRFTEMVEGVKKVALLDDPTDRLYDGRTLENGLTLYKRSVPFGVVGVIYEARPNVTVDIAALCLKSGNACFLRGGKEAINTNRVLHKLICSALKNLGLDEHMVTFLDDTSREYVAKMLALNEYIDVLIPRGGEALQRMCQKESSIPVIIGGFGISHIFVDESADLNRCVDIIINAKTQKPSACNSLDTLLLHEKIAQKFIELLTPKLKEKQVTVFAHG
ncbi:MAG TPA: glutamate-5-semialdehyde dehydrogenase, partial [Succinivibrio sp.]|nr:glutamate-5-semialdehyde dehydrogenase [Succinivibrio sp.]